MTATAKTNPSTARSSKNEGRRLEGVRLLEGSYDIIAITHVALREARHKMPRTLRLINCGTFCININVTRELDQ